MVRIKKRGRRRLRPPSPEVPGEGVRYPFVAIVGRPNVGKSTLFNRLIRQRLAIVEPIAGTTRDRVAALVELPDGRKVEVCDTGGMGGTGDAHDKDVQTQIGLAMDYADLILFVVDTRAGMTPLDQQIARRVKKLDKPVLVAANKAETQALEQIGAGEFYALGFPGSVVPISAQEGLGRSELLEALTQLVDKLPAPEEEEAEEEAEEDDNAEPSDVTDETVDEELPAEPAARTARLMRLAIMGRRNVGKSTYVNQLCGEERVIASAKAGTTRDAVDVRVEVDGREVVLIDTAGLRKRGKADDHIEIISHNRAQEALRRCDLCLLMLDCVDEISQVDKKLAGTIADEHKGCVIVANKWDLVGERMSPDEYGEYVGKMLPGLGYAPMVAISAKEGTRARAPLEVAFELFAQAQTQVGTGVLNRALAGAIELRRPRPKRNRLGKIYFGTQVAINPVTILLFVNDPELFDRAYRRYLAAQLRQRLPWPEIPIKLVFRAREGLSRNRKRLARHAAALGGLADQPRWIEQGVGAPQEVAEALDAAEVQETLRDLFHTDREDDDQDDAPEVPSAAEPARPAHSRGRGGAGGHAKRGKGGKGRRGRGR